MHVSRRHFLKTAAATSLGFVGFQRFVRSADMSVLASRNLPSTGYGELIPDPNGLLNLPKGFTYRVISRVCETMTDGFLVPGAHDGMAAFQGNGKNETILIRNHELNPDAKSVGPFG
ncbi:MAG: DUF839 domain-containing protein, partial [Candidatus Poribacteria bacterium]|nr:DUF839 domain-containing protein [Candidatus Poribacteria bacterium]